MSDFYEAPAPEYETGFKAKFAAFMADKRKRNIAIIAVAVILVVILLFAVVFKSNPEDVAEKFAVALIEGDYEKAYSYLVVDYEDFMKEKIDARDGDWEDYLEDLSDLYDEDFDSYSDYLAYISEDTKDDLEDEYGDDYKITVTDIDSDDVKKKEAKSWLSSDEMKAMKKCGFDVKDCDEFMCVTVELAIEGSEDEDEAELEVYLAKDGAKWKVIDWDW